MKDKYLKNSLIPKRPEMVETILKNARPIERTEKIPFYSGAGRVSAEDVRSVNTLPNYPVSRFDGIAVRYKDFEAGMPDTSGWTEGNEYVYANTGIAIPEGYDTVIPIEDVTKIQGKKEGLNISRKPEFKGEIVNDVGGNLRKDEIIINKGDVITPGHVGLFASGGITEIKVLARPRVAIIPTGDELISPTDNVPLKKNIESNSYMIESYLRGLNIEPSTYHITRDEPEIIKSTLKDALEENDAAIIIAGSSLGTKDFTIRILNELGDVVVPELAHGPGRKSSLSVLMDKPVLGVAGPPMGAQITCDLYLTPLADALCGRPYVRMPKLDVISDDSFIKYDVDFNERVHIYRAEDGYHMRSIFSHQTTRSQMQRLANGNYYRPAGTSLKPGDMENVELLCPIEYILNQDMLTDVLSEASLGKDEK